jgi:hypothetical protein
MHDVMTKRARKLGLGLAAAALGAMALASGASARPFSTHGAFVIGDQSVNVGDTVTFWGAQWWKDNDLSVGTAPASFKGFADTAVATEDSCGSSWTTRPGNSSFPPAAPLPDTLRMVVSSTITKSGPVISGDVTEVVEVTVKPGYEPNPGHPGTGTVKDILCQLGGLPT